MDEKCFRELLGVKRVIAFSYARHALVSALKGAGLRKGDEVLLSPLTCKVVPLAIMSVGLVPRYVDIAQGTLNLDPMLAAKTIGDRTRAVVFQHTYGLSEGLAEIRSVARKNRLLLVEDRAQCMPVRGDEEGVMPEFGVAIYSNNLRKPLPASAGGLAATNDVKLAREIRRFRDRMSERTLVEEVALRGAAYIHDWCVGPRTYWILYEAARMISSVHRDRGLVREIRSEILQPAKIPSKWQETRALAWAARANRLAERRRGNTAYYAERLAGVPGLETVRVAPDAPLFYFPVLTDLKHRCVAMARRRLLELVAWPIVLPIYPVKVRAHLDHYNYPMGSCPRAETVAQRLIGLPTDETITDAHRKSLVDLLVRIHGC